VIFGAKTFPGNPFSGIASPAPRFPPVSGETREDQSCGVWHTMQATTFSTRYFPRATRSGVRSMTRAVVGLARGPMNGRHPTVSEIPTPASKMKTTSNQPKALATFLMNLILPSTEVCDRKISQQYINKRNTSVTQTFQRLLENESRGFLVSRHSTRPSRPCPSSDLFPMRV